MLSSTILSARVSIGPGVIISLACGRAVSGSGWDLKVFTPGIHKMLIVRLLICLPIQAEKGGKKRKIVLI
jgi:hypothetical protein